MSGHDVPRTQSTGLDWLAEGRRVVAATLIDTVGSAPLDPGAEMVFDDRGSIEGSVTGGCVEGALFDEAQAVLAGGPARVLRYGISDEDAATVGLMCGGAVQVFVHELTEDAHEPLEAARRAIDSGEPAAVATLLDGDTAGCKLAIVEGGAIGSLRGTDLLDQSVERDAVGLLGQGQTVVRRYGGGGQELGDDLRVYVQSFATPPSMVIFGAIDYSVAVARAARELGYRVTICDARAPFVQSPRFSAVADVVVDWPNRFLDGRRLDERDVVLVFTHDPKFDEPALIAALATDAGYIGALGSRRTQQQRLERLREAGVDEDGLTRIAAPCGLDIGARTPAETAVSILAEVIAERTGRRGGRLSEEDVPIHPRGAPIGS
jgi:xanthine dehydrogenase accessory factor